MSGTATTKGRTIGSPAPSRAASISRRATATRMPIGRQPTPTAMAANITIGSQTYVTASSEFWKAALSE